MLNEYSYISTNINQNKNIPNIHLNQIKFSTTLSCPWIRSQTDWLTVIQLCNRVTDMPTLLLVALVLIHSFWLPKAITEKHLVVSFGANDNHYLWRSHMQGCFVPLVKLIRSSHVFYLMGQQLRHQPHHYYLIWTAVTVLNNDG